MFLVANRIGRGRRMVTEPVNTSHITTVQRRVIAYLTCSLIRVVSPTSASASHFPRKSSPKKGFRGFFSEPSFSLREQYCWWRVLRNHFRTARALFSGSGSLAGATRSPGCSAQ